MDLQEMRMLPREADYRSVLPAAMHSEAKRRTFFPVNGNTFTSTGNNIIRIDLSGDAFLDTKHSYLRFNFNNTTGQNLGFDYAGGHVFIRRLRIEQAGNVLSDVNHYNRLVGAIILPSQATRDSIQHRSLTEQQRWSNDIDTGLSMIADGTTAPASVTGATLTTPANSGRLILDNAAGAPPTDGSQAEFCIPLINGLLGVNQDKMIPLQLLGSSPITIEIELAPHLDIGVYQAAPAAGVTYELNNVRYVASLVESPPEVDDQIRMVQQMSGGRLVLSGTDYTHFNGNVGAGATGQVSINVPARRRSINSIFFVGASQDYAAAGIAQRTRFNNSFGGNFNLTDYQVKIGSITAPPTPIQCNYGIAGWDGETRAEHLTELSKCWGTLSTTHGCGSLSASNFATTDCDIAGMATDTAPGAASVSYTFCPFGIDLRSFARVATSSGFNTADRSTAITLLLNIGDPNVEAINVDAYISYDSLYYIDESGSIRVSL